MKVDNIRPESKNLVTEYVTTPKFWTLDDPRYTWLTDKDKEYLNSFPFDYGDIMNCANYYMPIYQVHQLLLCEDSELEQYCMCLWKKPFKNIYSALLLAMRNESIENIFDKWAKEGSSTAIAIMGKSVVKLDADEASKPKDLRIRIVNDLDDDDKEEERLACDILSDGEDDEGDE